MDPTITCSYVLSRINFEETEPQIRKHPHQGHTPNKWQGQDLT